MRARRSIKLSSLVVDLATSELHNERYVDCVANPAAAVWEAPPRSGDAR